MGSFTNCCSCNKYFESQTNNELKINEGETNTIDPLKPSLFLPKTEQYSSNLIEFSREMNGSEYLKKLKIELEKWGFVSEKEFDQKINEIRECSVIGFDVDFTLSMYNQENLLTLVYDCVRKHIIEKKNWPAKELPEIDESSIRLLHEFTNQDIVIDYNKGNALKLDKDWKIIKAYHGTNEMIEKQIIEEYGEEKLCPEFNYLIKKDNENHFQYYHDSFCSSLIFIFLKGIDIFCINNQEGQYEKKTPQQVLNDYYSGVNNAFILPNALENFSTFEPYYKTIYEKFENYLLIDFKEKIFPLLKLLKSKGKGLFLATNSQYTYSRFIIEKTIKDYQNYFDLCFFKSAKPRFFNPNDPGSIYYEKEEGNLTELVNLTPEIFNQIKGGQLKLFIGGCFYFVDDYFKNALPTYNGKFLYIGDSIQNDCACIDKLKQKGFDWRSIFIYDQINLEGMEINRREDIHYNKLYGKKWKIIGNDGKDGGEIKNGMARFFKEGLVDFALPNIEGLKYIFEDK